MQLGQQILHVQHDLRDILLDAGDGGKLVLDTGNLDAGGCSAGQRGEHDAPQRIAQGRSVTALQGFDHIFSIGSIAGRFDTLDLGLLNFDHAVPSFILVTVRTSPHLLGFLCFMRVSTLLLGVQLDDEVLLDVIVKVFLNRHTKNLSCLVVLVYIKPCRSCL